MRSVEDIKGKVGSQGIEGRSAFRSAAKTFQPCHYLKLLCTAASKHLLSSSDHSHMATLHEVCRLESLPPQTCGPLDAVSNVDTRIHLNHMAMRPLKYPSEREHLRLLSVS